MRNNYWINIKGEWKITNGKTYDNHPGKKRILPQEHTPSSLKVERLLTSSKMFTK